MVYRRIPASYSVSEKKKKNLKYDDARSRKGCYNVWLEVMVATFNVAKFKKKKE